MPNARTPFARGGIVPAGKPYLIGTGQEVQIPAKAVGQMRALANPGPAPMLPQLVSGSPLLIHPDTAAHAVREVLQAQQPDQKGYINWGTPWHTDAAGIEPNYDVKDGVAIIRIASSLWHAGYAWSGHSYAGIRLQLAHAIDAASIKGVLLDINSPGGDVAGLFDLVDEIEQMRSVKPIWALANEGAFSAAYGIAAAAERIITPRTGQLGSIGVITTHWDYSEELSQWGIQVTPIYAGDGKTDGAYFQPLSDEARARFQASVDSSYKLFTATVARLRTGDAANADDVVALGAHTFTGQDAVDAGLADDVMSPHEALAALIEHVADTPSASAASAGGVEAAGAATQPAQATGENDMSLRDKALARRAAADAANGQKASDDDDKTEDENEDDTKASDKTDDDKASENKDEDKASDDPDDDKASDDKDDDKASDDPDDDKASDDKNDDKAEDKAEDKDDDKASSAKSERARIQAITGAPEAAGRGELAKHLAFETEMDADAAIAMLGKAPKGSSLDEQMKGQNVPDTGNGGGSNGSSGAQGTAGGLLKARAEKRAADAKAAARR